MGNIQTLGNLEAFVLFGMLLILMLLINSLMILGLNLITQGRTELLPDGSTVNKGKIAYPIRKYFEQSSSEKMFYSGVMLNGLIAKFKSYYPHIKYEAIGKGRLIAREDQKINFEVNQKAIEEYLGCKMAITQDGHLDTYSIKFYKIIAANKFPDWIRDVIYNCPPCMSTIYGTLFYWTNMLYIFSFEFSPRLVIVWLGYWLALAYTNYKLEKK